MPDCSFARNACKPLPGGSMFGVEHLLIPNSPFIDKLRDPLVNMVTPGWARTGTPPACRINSNTSAGWMVSFFFNRRASQAYILFIGLSKKSKPFFLEQRRGNVGPLPIAAPLAILSTVSKRKSIPDYLNSLLFFQPGCTVGGGFLKLFEFPDSSGL